MSFRDNLLYLRDSRNTTQEHLAMLLGATRQAVGKWESGASTPDMDKLVRLCEIFEVDLDEMIRGGARRDVREPDGPPHRRRGV